MSATLAVAGGAVALPRLFTATLLPRVLGLYIAGCAGFVQLLDILVDRLHLDDRIFTFSIVLAVIGIPFAAAAALLADTSRAERQRPAQPQRTAAPAYPPQVAEPPAQASDDAADALRRRLELTLTYRRIAVLHEAAGDSETAGTNDAAWRREALLLADALQRLAAVRPDARHTAPAEPADPAP